MKRGASTCRADPDGGNDESLDDYTGARTRYARTRLVGADRAAHADRVDHRRRGELDRGAERPYGARDRLHERRHARELRRPPWRGAAARGRDAAAPDLG